MPESKPPPSPVVKVVVTAPGQDLKAAIPVLQRCGLQIDGVLESIGVITGRVTEQRIAQLERIKGITVERDQSVAIGPPRTPQ